MHRLSGTILLFMVLTARAAPNVTVEMTPVGVTCEVAVAAITNPWPDLPAAQQRLAAEAKRILDEDPGFKFWMFAAVPRPSRIHIAFEQRPKNHLIATVSIRKGNAIREVLPSITILTPVDLESKGWPTEEAEIKAFLATHVLTVATRNDLRPLMQKAVEIGAAGAWNTTPPIFAVPVRWSEDFATYSSVLRAGPALKLVYGMSLHRKAEATDGTKVLVARAKCVQLDGTPANAAEVPDLGTYTLGPVHLHAASNTSVPPVLDCTNEGLAIR